MSDVERLLEDSAVHPEWRDIVGDALAAMEADYLASLLSDPDWLPGTKRLLAAFRRDRRGLRYILIGESPYPRAESANGIAFYDAAVDSLWSDKGLSKAVNRATSLRNLIKTALLAEKLVTPNPEGKLEQDSIAALDKSELAQTLADLFARLESRGFLMLNATPVLHARRKPRQEARYWTDFMRQLLKQIETRQTTSPQLVLWGKIAAVIDAMPEGREFPRIVCEHPYNLSFIDNPQMRQLFAELRLLRD